MILSRIIEEKRREVEEAKRQKPIEELAKEVRGICVKSSFKKNISRPHHINLIAEIKKASPSKGILRGDFNPDKDRSDISGERRQRHICPDGRAVLRGQARIYKEGEGERFSSRSCAKILS